MPGAVRKIQLRIGSFRTKRILLCDDRFWYLPDSKHERSPCFWQHDCHTALAGEDYYLALLGQACSSGPASAGSRGGVYQDFATEPGTETPELAFGFPAVGCRGLLSLLLFCLAQQESPIKFGTVSGSYELR